MATTLQNSKMKFWVFIVGLLCVCSCKKELTCENAIQLFDKKTSFLVASWEWRYSTRRIQNTGTGNYTEDTVFNEDVSNIYKIKIEDNGRITLYKNESKIKQYCVMDTTFYNSSYYQNHVNINLNLSDNNKESSEVFYFHILNEELLKCSNENLDFPFASRHEEGNQLIFYTNHFTKI